MGQLNKPIIRTEYESVRGVEEEPLPKDLPRGAQLILPDQPGGTVYIDLEGYGRVSLAEYRMRKLGPE